MLISWANSQLDTAEIFVEKCFAAKNQIFSADYKVETIYKYRTRKIYQLISMSLKVPI